MGISLIFSSQRGGSYAYVFHTVHRQVVMRRSRAHIQHIIALLEVRSGAALLLAVAAVEVLDVLQWGDHVETEKFA